MKIKTTKQMRLDELIKYIFDNGIEDEVFQSNGGSTFDMCEARVSGSGNIKTSGYINEHTTFIVEVEEELTEHTVFDEFHEYFWDLEDGLGVTEIITNESISGILQEHDGETVPLSITVRRRADNEPILIWSRDTGIPEEGVIET